MVVFVIKQLRKQKKISQYRLSKMTNISRTYIRNLETNKQTNPTLLILCSIAEALEVNIKDLFYSRLDINLLKEELYVKIEKYGLGSDEVMEINQLLDLLVNLEQEEKRKKEKMEANKN